MTWLLRTLIFFRVSLKAFNCLFFKCFFFLVLFLGCNADYESSCDYMKTGYCIKQYVDCDNASECNRDSMHCGQTEYCLKWTPACLTTIHIMKYCSDKYNCSSPFKFNDVVRERCMLHHANHHTSSVAPTLASFAVTTGCFLTYFVMKENEWSLL